MRWIFSLILATILFACGNTSIEEASNAENADSTALDTVNYDADYKATTIMKVGTTVPDFTLTTLDGELFRLSDQKGKIVFINFFALTCPICIKELPMLEKQIWQKYKGNTDIVILCIGRQETKEKLTTFRDKKRYTFPIATDTNRAVYAMFAEKYIPRNIIIDKDGKLIFSEVGYNEEKFQKLQEEIKKSLN